MATKETITDLVRLMATLWRFPSDDLKATAAAYHLGLRELSDQETKSAVTELSAAWGKTTAPKPADILRIAKELRPVSKPLPRLPPREPTHQEIMAKIKRDTAMIQVIEDVLGEQRKHLTPTHWTLEESRAISKRQAQIKAQHSI